MEATNGVKGGHPVVVGITGASGSLLARAAIDVLLDDEGAGDRLGHPSSAARMVWREEMDESFGAALERWADSGEFTHYASGDLAAPIASGTFPVRGMAIVPCSMATAAAVAHGFADNLIRRAADVTLKERRPLVMVPRESPLSALHLENLAAAARLGVTVIPPEPAFYLEQETMGDVAAFVTQRVLLALGVIDALPEEMQYRPRGV